MPGELERLAYDVSLYALTRQEELLEELRSRAGTLLAASSLSASFLGSRALDQAGARWLGLLALSLFAVSVISAVFVIVPSREVVFSLRGSAILAPEISGQGLAVTHRHLTYWIEGFLEANEAAVERRLVLFRISAGTALAGVILWSVQIAY